MVDSVSVSGQPGLPVRLAAGTSHRLGAIGLAVVATVWLLAVAATREIDATAVAGYVATLVLIGALLGVLRVRDVRSRRSVLLWPAAGNLLLLALSWSDPRAATLCVSTITIAYVAIGVTQPRWSSLVLLPLSIVVSWFALDLPPGQAAVRILIASSVWVAAAEVPAWLIAQLAEARAMLSRIASTDSLTGLPNRRGWEDQFGDLTGHASRAGEAVTIMLVDLDRFKAFNDIHGHLAGDDLLVHFGRRLRDLVRSGDLVARWGGEEFAVALRECDLASAGSVADRICAGVPGKITCSVGVTAYVPGESLAATLGRADVALYRAKREGRHCVRVA